MRPTNCRFFLYVLGLILILSGFGQSAFAADEPRGQFTAFGGGVHLTDGGGNHAALGANIGAYTGGRVLLLGEFTYIPLGKAGLSGDLGPAGSFTSSGSIKLYEFNGGVHINLVKQSKVIPYLAAGAGLGRSSGSYSATVRSGNSTTTVSASASGNNFGVNGGFGVKLYAGKHWGIQPEVKVFRFIGDGGGTAIRFGGGLFFDF